MSRCGFSFSNLFHDWSHHEPEGRLEHHQLGHWKSRFSSRPFHQFSPLLADGLGLFSALDVQNSDFLREPPCESERLLGYSAPILEVVGARNTYFWATQSGAELDLLILKSGKRYGIEVRYGDAPGVTKSMRLAVSDLALKQLFVVYPGEESYPVDAKIQVVSLPKVCERLRSQNPDAK